MRTPRKRVVGLTISMLVIALTLAVSALASSSVKYSGSVGTASLGLTAKVSSGKIVAVKSFVWDGLKCGSDRFTGGSSEVIKVKNNSFSSTQPVGGVSVPLKMVVTGKFTNGKASGTLRIKGGCSTGKIAKIWKAHS